MINNIDGEEWRDIKGYEGLYQVSNYGRVKSLPKEIFNGNGYYTTNIRLLKGVPNNMGYYLVNLCYEGNRERFLISRLVAKAFPEICGEWFEGCIIDHLDTNPANNVAWNLKVGTHKDNSNNPLTKIKMSKARIGVFCGEKSSMFGKHHTEESKRKMSERQKNNPSKSKPVFQYTKDKELVKIWDSTRECERNGFQHSSVGLCCIGKYKQYKGFIWSYSPINTE